MMTTAPKPPKRGRCKVHPQYMAHFEPRVQCEDCWNKWNRKQELKKDRTLKRRRSPAGVRELFKEAERLQSLYVRARDRACVLCHERDHLQAGHVFSRVFREIFFHPLNVHCQCAKCNHYHEADQIPYHRWFKKRYGETEFDLLYQKTNRTRKFTEEELALLIVYFRRELKELEPDQYDLFVGGCTNKVSDRIVDLIYSNQELFFGGKTP